ncbi:hypothetical protein QM012_006094 [Aureobasidium pullulans]|uniref:Uncharacterized protein n=1 Tax=Aureobasidium pullulans TaxID=5580 RepID=A0ABR0TT87_AURPU
MAAYGNPSCIASNDDIVEMPAQNLTPKVEPDRGDSSPIRLCFAPSEQPCNHGSDRLRPLRTMPFDSQIWVGNFDDLGSRVWPHPSFKELIARSRTGSSKFPLPDTVARDARFQTLRLRCCGTRCCPTTHSPFVEYERPSRLETLTFISTQNVIIYPFYVRSSKHAGLQRFFAIVNRQKDGEYKFWRANGTYHESYGLAKGSVSIFESPKSAHSTTSIGSPSSSKRQLTSTPTKRGSSAARLVDDLDDTPLRFIQKARTLNRSRDINTQLANGLDIGPLRDSAETPSKRRAIADLTPTQARGGGKNKTSSMTISTASNSSKNTRVRGRSRTSTEQSNYAGVQTLTNSLLHINEVCMLAYHLVANNLKLKYRTNAFTIERGEEGSLVDPLNGCAFQIDKQHAMYVLSSSEKSLKVILSQNSTWTVAISCGKMTGGIILLEFGNASARDEFIARIRYMVGMTVGRIGCADDVVIESMYSKLLEQFDECRSTSSDDQNDNEISSQKFAERTQSLPAENSSEVNGENAVSCPPSLTETSSCQVPATPVASQSASPSVIPRPQELPQPCLPAETSSAVNMPQAIVTSSTNAPSRQSQGMAITKTGSDVSISETIMKKELQNLLREVYIKYPSAHDDDYVEEMALLLKAPLLAGDKERVKELRMDLKVYLISHHG